MAHVAFIVDIPNRVQASLPNFLDIGEELARLVRKDTRDDSARLIHTAITDLIMVPQAVNGDTFTAPSVPSDKTQNKKLAPKRITIAGGAAGNLTATGIKTTHSLISVISVDDTTHVGTDLTSQFTVTAANTINNTGGTATTGGHVTVVWA